MNPWLALVLPALLAWAAARLLRRSPLAARLADLPNERSLHGTATPRVGGLALWAGALPVAAWCATPAIATLLGGAVLLAALSALDDMRSLPIEVRLPVHLGVAFVCVLAIASPAEPVVPWGWAGVALTVLALAWMTNLFNFMDGADGLAAGMAIIGFGAYAWAAFDAGAVPLACASAAIAAAACGFLPENFPPARAFLGDAGSIPLGFLAGALGLHGAAGQVWPVWFPLLVFSPFIVDATLTVLRRLARGERIWRAHREHAYQRLALAGWPRRRLALAAYALMAAMAAAALVALRREAVERWAIILVCLAIYAVLLAAIDRRYPSGR